MAMRTTTQAIIDARNPLGKYVHLTGSYPDGTLPKGNNSMPGRDMSKGGG